MPVRLEAEFVGLEKSAQLAAKRAGKNLKLNLGTSAKSIEALSQPLGRITGRADEFTKSMEAANARVLAFGASVGVLNGVTNGFKALVSTTIQVEKSLASINSILKVSTSELDKFKNQIFEVAKGTEQTFQSAAEAALELSRQGLSAVEVTQRLNDSLVLARLSGLGTGEAVAGLTAAINAFNSTGITSAEVLNKISAAAASAAVSDRDLIEGLKRSGSVAVTTGVSFDNLVGIISALQEKTARGGAVIGNSLKTIFTRISTIDKLETLENLGVQVTNLEGEVLAADKIIQNLAGTFDTLSRKEQVNLADKLVGKFQIAPFLALLQDFNAETVRSNQVAAVSFNATNEAYQRNAALNETLAALINKTTVNVQELANSLGEIGVTDSLKGVLSFFDGLITNIRNIFEGEGVGGDFARGIVKGISKVITGPGLAIFGAIIAKLTVDLAKFGVGSLQTFFGLNKAAKEQAALQGQIASSLLSNKSIQDAILAIENSSLTTEQKRLQQTEFFTTALNTQLATMKQMQSIAGSIAPGVLAGTAAARGGRGRGAFGRGAGGFLPIGSEKSDISRGVGGAPSSAKPVVIPNFAFGGGKFGTMVANSSEYLVPNYAGGGDAIFNQNMISSMGLPANAKKIRAAGGYIPNFAKINSKGRYVLLTGQKGGFQDNSAFATIQEDGSVKYTRELLDETSQEIRVPTYGLPVKGDAKDIETFIKDLEQHSVKESIKQAKILSGGEMPTPPKQAAIRAEVNKGAVAGFAGSLFELTLAALLTDEEFLKYASLTDTSNFDLNLKGQQRLLNVYDIPGSPSFGEVKGRANNDNIKSTAAKIFRVLGQGQVAQKSQLVGNKMSKNDAIRLGLVDENFKRSSYVIKAGDLDKINRNAGNARISTRGGIVKFGAGGYIPNFSALDEAVARETSAGLPINQVRINQSGKLRNAANPMGLAVTNTRDEPRGTVPNFATPEERRNTQIKDNTGKLIGLSLATSVLTSAFQNVSSEQEGFAKALNSFASGLTSAISTLTLFQALGANVSFNPSTLKEQSESFAERGAAFGEGAERLGLRLQAASSLRSSGAFGLKTRGAGITNTLGKAVGGAGKIIGKLGAGLGRLIPFIGPVVIGFQAINAITGGALMDNLKKFGTNLLQTFNIIDTPAEKAAKALNKLTDATISQAAVTGDFTQDTIDTLINQVVTASRERRAQQELNRAGVTKEEDETAVGRLAIDRFTQGAFSEGSGFARFLATATREEIIGVERTQEFIPSGSRLPAFNQAANFRNITAEGRRLDEADITNILSSALAAVRRGEGFRISNLGTDGQGQGSLESDIINIGGREFTSLDALSLEIADNLDKVIRLNAATSEQRTALATARTDKDFENTFKSVRVSAEDLKFQFKALEELFSGGFSEETEKRLAEITKGAEQVEKIITAASKIRAAVTKERLKNETDLRALLLDTLDIRKQEQTIEAGLLSTSKARKIQLDAQLATADRQKKSLDALVKTAGDKLSGALLSDDQEISPEDARKIQDFIQNTQKTIRETNGLREDQIELIKKEAPLHLKNKDALDQVLRTTIEISNRRNLEEAILRERAASNKFITFTINEQNEALRKGLDLIESQLRRTSDLSSAQNRLADARADLQIAELEERKIGVGNTARRNIDAQIAQVRRQALREANDRQREAEISSFRAEVFQTARALDPNLVRGVLANTDGGAPGTETLEQRLSKANTEQQFQQILRDLDAKQKELLKKQSEVVAQERLDSLLNLQAELSNTTLFGNAVDIFKKTVENFAANKFVGILTQPGEQEFSDIGPEGGSTGGAAPQTRGSLLQERIEQARRDLDQAGSLVGLGNFFKTEVDLRKLFLNLEASGVELDVQLKNLANQLKESGASAVTFVNLLRDRFLNLDEALARNFFDIQAGSDITTVINSAISAQSNRRLERGPVGLGAINEADRQTRRSQLQLRLAGVTGFAERTTIIDEFNKTEELFNLRDEMNRAGIDAEKIGVALIEKKLEIEGRRKSLTQELAERLLTTEQQMFKDFTTGTAEAVVSFRDGLASGIREAIQGTGDLRDALLSAVTAFNNKILESSLNSIFGNITNSLFGDAGAKFLGVTANSGGMINGGSGVRDDVPALLTGGEFVVNRKSVQKYGRGFFESLNNGTVPGFQTGGFFAPGLFGQGPITGKRDLLSFATQGFTSGRQDVLFGSGGTAAIGLEPESVRLTNRGRAMGTPLQRATRDAKSQAFGLFNQQNELEARLREEERQKKKQLRNAIIGLGASLLLGSAAAGGLASTKAGGGFFEGVFKGGAVKGESGSFGGLGNLLSGRLNRAFIAEPFKKQAMGGGVAGIDTVPTMLSAGEFVMNSAASQNIGAGNLAALNAGSSSIVTEETAEQLNQNLINKLDEVIDSSGGMGDINITINSDSGRVTQNGGEGNEANQNLARQIRDAVVNVIEQEKRLGGSLRRGLA